jgi:hypothetical protein
MTKSTGISQKTLVSEPQNRELLSDIPADDVATSAASNIPNPEASLSQGRRRFTSDYKMRILDELDRSSVHGEKGAILRREGLYSSQVAEWRRQRDEGALSALSKIRGRKKKQDARDEKIDDLEKKLHLLESKLAQAEAIIDVQKKVSEIFGISNLTNQRNESKS